MKALSIKQQEVLRLMANGWELGQGMDRDGRCWIQKGGLGMGGEAETVSNATLHSLWRKNLIIEVAEAFPLRRFGLKS